MTDQFQDASQSETESAAGDRDTVGVSAEGASNLASLMATKYFEEEGDAYRTAICYALAHPNIPVPDRVTGVQTKFNVGTLDREGKLRLLVSVLAPDRADRPYDYCQRLADAGLRALYQEVEEHGTSIPALAVGLVS
jgi:hypothetical protein